MGELYLQASLIQFSFDQKPERRPPQMGRAATEWELLAVVLGFAALLCLAVIRFGRSSSFFSLSFSLSSDTNCKVTGGYIAVNRDLGFTYQHRCC